MKSLSLRWMLRLGTVSLARVRLIGCFVPPSEAREVKPGRAISHSSAHFEGALFVLLSPAGYLCTSSSVYDDRSHLYPTANVPTDTFYGI